MTVNASAQQPTGSIVQERVRTARPPRSGYPRKTRSKGASLVADSIGIDKNVENLKGLSTNHKSTFSVEDGYSISVNGSNVLLERAGAIECRSDLNLSISFACAAKQTDPEPISVENGLLHGVIADAASGEWDEIDKNVLAESSAFNQIVMAQETEDLLQEFEELWTGTYPQLGEAIEQASPVSFNELVANVIGNSVEPGFLDKLVELEEVITEGLEDQFETLGDSGSVSTDCVQPCESTALSVQREETGTSAIEVSRPSHRETSAFESYEEPLAPSDLRLGQLLVDLNLITKELLKHAIMASAEMSISLGRFLIMSGCLTSSQLQWSVQLQALLRENVLSLGVAVRIAELMSCSGMTIHRALNCVDKSDALEILETRATRLGDLLIQSEIISEEKFNDALNKSQSFGVPIGKYLVVAGLITAQLLETAVNAQRYVRDGKMQKADAIVAIRQAVSRQLEIQKGNANRDYENVPLRTMRLGEILTLSGVVSETHLEHAVEFGLRCNLAVGQVLVDFEILTQETLDVALVLQNLVLNGSLEPIDAAYVLIDVHHHGYTMSAALKRNRNFRTERKVLSFEQFVAGLELLSPPQIEESIEDARRSPMFVSRALVTSGALSEETAQTALTCHFYVREEMLTVEESLLLFHLCHRTGLTVEEGIVELGLKVRLRV